MQTNIRQPRSNRKLSTATEESTSTDNNVDIGITKQDYKMLNHALGDVFGCTEIEIDHVFKTLTKLNRREQKQKAQEQLEKQDSDPNNKNHKDTIKFVTDTDYVEMIQSIDFHLFQKMADNKLHESLELLQQSQKQRKVDFVAK